MFKFIVKIFRKIFYCDLNNFYLHCYLIIKDVAVLDEYLNRNGNSDAARRYIINAKYNLSKVSPLYYKFLKYNTNKFQNDIKVHDCRLIRIYSDKGSENYEFFSGFEFKYPHTYPEKILYVNPNMVICDGISLPFSKFEIKLFKYTYLFQKNYEDKLKKFIEEEKIKKTLNSDF